jgi:endogenous inhibitor of DNA gyrase (YacG/DUF329 family)
VPDICPICRRPATQDSRPFCSPRCAEVDLGRWFTEQYRVPVAPTEEPDEQAADDPSSRTPDPAA